jgi:hypothetical protein
MPGVTVSVREYWDVLCAPIALLYAYCKRSAANKKSSDVAVSASCTPTAGDTPIAHAYRPPPLAEPAR